jgi:hypothetical protein
LYTKYERRRNLVAEFLTQDTSAASTWRRPPGMPVKVCEEVNVNIERQLLRWAKRLLLACDGNVRKLSDVEAREIITPGEWLRRSRAARKGAGNRRRPLAAKQRV